MAAQVYEVQLEEDPTTSGLIVKVNTFIQSVAPARGIMDIEYISAGGVFFAFLLYRRV